MMSDTTTQTNGAQLQKPGLGLLSASAEGIVSVGVTTVPPGSEARVDYAVSKSAPPADSGEWTFLGKTGPDSTLRTPVLGAGRTVWVRLRSEAPTGFSGWVDPAFVRTPPTARVHDVRITLDPNQQPTVTWDRNEFTGGVRIRYATHPPDRAPGEMGRLDDDAAAARRELPVQVQPGEALTVEVRPWTGWDGESVLGDAGVPIRRSQGIAPDASTTALINCREVERTPSGVLYQWLRGPAVAEVWVYDLLHPQPVPSDPWPKPEDVRFAMVLASENEYRAEIPPQGYVRYLQFEPRTESLATGTVQRFHILPVSTAVAMTALLKPVISGAAASLSLTVQGSGSAFPLMAEIMEDDPDSAPIAPAHTFTAPGTIGPEQYPSLSARELPPRELRRWYVRLTDAAGEVTWAFAAADRDALPGGVVTPRDQQSRPALVCLYDDDTDRVQITVPGGKTLTHPAPAAPPLAGSGTFTYTVADALDDGTSEPRLRVGETRSGYRVRYQGGGTWQTVWDGVLHGSPSSPPVVETRVVPSQDGKRASVYVKVTSPVQEWIRLNVRDSAAADAPVHRLVVGASDPGPRYVESGVELGPTDYFHDGLGAPAPKLADLPLLRDQIRSIFVQAQGEDSGVASDWVPVTFGILEKPWLESVDLVWDEDNDLLRLTAMGGAHCRSSTFQIGTDPSFTGVAGEDVALADGERRSIERALVFADRKKVWYGRVTPRNGGLTGEAQQDTEYVPEPPRPQIGAIRQVAGSSNLTTNLTVQVAAARAKATDPKGMGGTLYIWTNKAGNGDANPSATATATADASVTLTDTPVEVTADLTPALHDVLVWPGRGKQVHVKFVAADGGDSGVVTQTLYSWLDLVGADGKLVPGAVDRPAAFAASIAPFRRVSALPASGAFDGERVFVAGTSANPNQKKAFQWSAASSAWSQVEPSVGDYSFLPVVAASAISADELAASAVTTDKLNVARVFVSGMGLTNHSPSTERVAWTGCQVVYRGMTYRIAAGNTAAEVIWWRNQTGYNGTFQGSSAATLQTDGYDQTRGDAIILLNQSGTALEVWNGTMIYDGMIATDAVKARHIEVTNLAAINADLGTITAGILQNAASNPTAAVRLNNTYTLPTPSPTTCYLDLAATGSAPFLYHPKLQLNADGSAAFSGTVRIGAGTTYDPDYNPAEKETPAGASAKASTAENNAKGASLDKATYLTPNTTTIEGGKITAHTITADHITINQLSSISRNAGIIVSGKLRNESDTYGISISGSPLKNDNATPWTRYLNLSDDGFPFLKHERFRLDHSGSAWFGGTVQLRPGSGGSAGSVLDVFDVGGNRLAQMIPVTAADRSGVALSPFGAVASLSVTNGATTVIAANADEIRLEGNVSFAVKEHGGTIWGFPVNFNEGSTHSCTLIGDIQFFLTNGKAGARYYMIVKQDAVGGRSIVFEPGIELFPGGVVVQPSGEPSSVTVYEYICIGTQYLVQVVGKDFRPPAMPPAGAPSNLVVTNHSYCSFRSPVYVLSLTWTNGDPHASTEICQDGVKIGVAGEGESGYSVMPAGGGYYRYSVRHLKNGMASMNSNEVNVSLVNPCGGITERDPMIS